MDGEMGRTAAVAALATTRVALEPWPPLRVAHGAAVEGHAADGPRRRLVQQEASEREKDGVVMDNPNAGRF